MLKGKRAFEGASAASVIAALLERDPAPLTETPPLDLVVRGKGPSIVNGVTQVGLPSSIAPALGELRARKRIKNITFTVTGTISDPLAPWSRFLPHWPSSIRRLLQDVEDLRDQGTVEPPDHLFDISAAR